VDQIAPGQNGVGYGVAFVSDFTNTGGNSFTPDNLRFSHTCTTPVCNNTSAQLPPGSSTRERETAGSWCVRERVSQLRSSGNEKKDTTPNMPPFTFGRRGSQIAVSIHCISCAF
jgi:hypothetical protein